jgi:hypothetical protein
MFKRLIGTESSFRADAVSPRGEKFGLGIAQIAAVHGLSREQMLDPNTAIPFAAQLFARYLQQAGGDYREALMRYKGATSEAGRRSMEGPISTIMSGVAPTTTPAPAPAPAAAPAQATMPAPTPAAFKPSDTPAKTADAVVKAAATSGRMYGPGAIDASPNNPAIQQVLNEREILVQRIQIAARYGFAGQVAPELLQQIRAIDLGLYKAQADQGIYEGTTMGNWSRAMQVLSHFRQQPHQVLNRGDGTFDLYVGGKLARTASDSNALTDFIRSNVDESYRQQKIAMAGREYESQLKIRETVAQEMLKAQGNTQVALINAQKELVKQGIISRTAQLRALQGGQLAVYQDGELSIIDPTTTTEVRGQTIPAPTRTRVP